MLKQVGMAWFAREKRERIGVLRSWWSRDVERGYVNWGGGFASGRYA
jgi:hypothetical protein